MKKTIQNESNYLNCFDSLKVFLEKRHINIIILVIYDFEKNMYMRYEENIHFLLEGESGRETLTLEELYLEKVMKLIG